MHQTLALAAVASVIGGCAASEPLVPYKNVTFASLNTTILSARVLPYDPRHVNATFAFEATCCGYGPFTEAAVEATSAAYGGLWDLPCGRPAEPEVAEVSEGTSAARMLRASALPCANAVGLRVL